MRDPAPTPTSDRPYARPSAVLRLLCTSATSIEDLPAGVVSHSCRMGMARVHAQIARAACKHRLKAKEAGLDVMVKSIRLD